MDIDIEEGFAVGAATVDQSDNGVNLVFALNPKLDTISIDLFHRWFFRIRSWELDIDCTFTFYHDNLVGMRVPFFTATGTLTWLVETYTTADGGTYYSVEEFSAYRTDFSRTRNVRSLATDFDDSEFSVSPTTDGTINSPGGFTLHTVPTITIVGSTLGTTDNLFGITFIMGDGFGISGTGSGTTINLSFTEPVGYDYVTCELMMEGESITAYFWPLTESDTGKKINDIAVTSLKLIPNNFWSYDETYDTDTGEEL